jgi:short-subunit dehydrogenase
VSWCAADLQVPAQIQRLAGAAAEWGCNVVVHSAGTPAFGALQGQDPAAMMQALQTNLLAPMVLTRALLGHLARQPQAQVLFVGSALGGIGLPGYSVYCATKFGLRGFAQALRREVTGTAVQVQYLGPRSTRTDFNAAEVRAYNRATGTAMDEPSTVAAAMVQMLESGRSERFLGFPEKLAVRINGLAPGWLDGSFRRHSRSVADSISTSASTSNPESMTT